MRCNLVKKNVVIHNDKENRDFSVSNYYLQFENGVIVPVECKEYTTRSTKKEDIEKLEKLNSTNRTIFSALADLLKDESK